MPLPIRAPVIPPAGAGFDVGREASNAKCLRDLISVVTQAFATLEEYAPRDVVDAFGNKFRALAKEQGQTAMIAAPWEVVDASDPAAPETTRVSVPDFSAVYEDPDCASALDIAGLGDAFPVVSGNWLYVEVPIRNGDVDDSEDAETILRCGEPWSRFPLKYETEEISMVEQQNKLFIPIARFGPVLTDSLTLAGPIVGTGDNAVQCYQLAHTHLMLLHVCGISGGLVIAVGAPGGS